MTLKKFNADFKNASQKVAGGGVPGVSSISRGDSEGEAVVTCRHESLPDAIRVQALAQNIDEYPDGNTFLLFTDDGDNPPKPILDAIKSVQDYLFGMRLYEMVSELSSHFQVALNANMTGKGQDQDEEAADEFDDSVDEDEDDYDIDDHVFGLPSARPFMQFAGDESIKNEAQLRQRLRRDLRQTKQAGYKVGLMDDLEHSGTRGIVSISIRAQKLGLSEQAMEAWDVQDNEYIVLLIRLNTYTPIERVIEQASSFTQVAFRIGKCTRYKPSFSQALAAFPELKPHDAHKKPLVEGAEINSDAEFRKLFISNSLEQYLNECFVSLLKLRVAKGCSWDEANSELESRAKNAYSMEDYDGKSKATTQFDDIGAGDPMDVDPAPEDHQILASDHLAQPALEHGRSFPLVAMEFAMHYFVKCTEYCLRCHQRVEKGFEALRPYVCSNPLCLFQYMSMGLGPSIEHDILTEPYVVDLLVSLCYTAIHPKPPGPSYNYNNTTANPTLPIRQFPVGLSLKIPSLHDWEKAPLKGRAKPDETRIFLDVEPPVSDGNVNGMDGRLGPGKWIAYRDPKQNLTKHAVIVEIHPSSKSFTVKHMGDSGAAWQPSVYGHMRSSATAPAPFDPSLVDIYFYDTDFDLLGPLEKAVAMRHILDTLPPIPEIAGFLKSHSHSSFRSMEGLSPPAATLLQWIVSSNRSCIFQVDDPEEIARHAQQSAQLWRQQGSLAGGAIPSPGETNLTLFEPTYTRKSREHDRIPGMEGWIQFRFAQGSPDKELKFRRALQEQAARIDIAKNPTIFAWHGSHLWNWHSIVRTGLDFNDVVNGRALGNGVYFSPQHSYSIGYTGGGGGGGAIWGNSTLNFQTCMSLNEIINATDKFTAKNQSAYVVQHNDWHQCRYLFVQSARRGTSYPGAPTAATAAQQDKTSAGKFHVQAPGLEILGPNGQHLQIPLAAIPFRHVGLDTQSTTMKRTTIRREEDESAEEDVEDVEFLFSDGESDGAASPPFKKTSSPLSPIDMAGRNFRPLTPVNTDNIHSDFVPGALNISLLATLKPPSFANNLATKALSREMKNLQEIQTKTPLHELGWYIDFDNIANLFQWIVEFHSFEPSLPLAQDMKTIGATSVVLEIRYGKDYPMTPPFVRVIRPRFLNFIEGGGGHVTAGGAMCMELLTNSGWSPANSIESVLLQVRMAMCNLEPRPARLQDAIRAPRAGYGNGYCNDYGIGEAVEAYMRAAASHGWSVPSDLAQTANGI